MEQIKALVLRAAGINCDLETEHALEMAGASAVRLHINRIIAEPALLDGFQIIVFPGGFSYGDSIAAGRIMANLMRKTLYPKFANALRRGVPMIAPCNGFQIAVQLGLLPGPTPGSDWNATAPVPTVALAQNNSARFIDKWVEFHVPSNTRCVWTKHLKTTETSSVIPIAHGEGRFVPKDESVLQSLEENGQIACRYNSRDNPNGSVGDVMGICDASGLVFGLMPHPERFLRWSQHPTWTRLTKEQMQGDTIGLQMFKNAVSHATKNKTQNCVEQSV